MSEFKNGNDSSAVLYFEGDAQIQSKIQHLIETTPQLRALALQGKPIQDAIQTVLDKKMADWDTQNMNQGYGSIKMRANWDLRLNGNSFEWKIGVLQQGQQPQEWQKMYALQQPGQAVPDSIGVSFSWQEVQQEMSVLAQNQEPKTQEVQYVSNLIDRQLTGFLMQNPDLIPFQQIISGQINKDAARFVQDGFIQSVERVSLLPSNVPNAVHVVFVDAKGKSAAIDIPLPDATSVEQVAQKAQAQHNRLALLRGQIE